MTYQLGNKSLQKLEGVHPDLVAVVKLAITLTEQDFSVGEGLRTVERQKKLVASGKSTTMNSRHITGHAVDLFPYPVSWDWQFFYPIAEAMKQAAEDLGVPIRWGGNWKVTDIRLWKGTAREMRDAYSGSFPDGPHLEIPRGFGYD